MHCIQSYPVHSTEWHGAEPSTSLELENPCHKLGSDWGYTYARFAATSSDFWPTHSGKSARLDNGCPGADRHGEPPPNVLAASVFSASQLFVLYLNPLGCRFRSEFASFTLLGHVPLHGRLQLRNLICMDMLRREPGQSAVMC